MSFTNLLYHVVFSTKNRRPAIEPAIREPLYQYLGGIIRSEGGIQLEIGGIADHVHILCKLRPDRSVSNILQQMKGSSSKWQHESLATWPGWQDEYAAFTVSESQVEAVRAYVRTQEEHHRTTSFRDELIALLRKNRIEFDERYL